MSPTQEAFYFCVWRYYGVTFVYSTVSDIADPLLIFPGRLCGLSEPLWFGLWCHRELISGNYSSFLCVSHSPQAVFTKSPLNGMRNISAEKVNPHFIEIFDLLLMSKDSTTYNSEASGAVPHTSWWSLVIVVVYRCCLNIYFQGK